MVMFDTMVCIWAFKREASPGQEEKLQQARALITELQEQGIEIGISTVTLAELLVAMKVEQRLPFLRSLEDTLCVYAFDTGAALEAARLFKEWRDSDDRPKTGRQVVKADCQIAGTALSSKAEILYTEDRQLARIAGPKMVVRPLPRRAQPELNL